LGYASEITKDSLKTHCF